MKMKTLKYNILLGAFIAVVAMSSCTKFDDMNKNPYALEDAPSYSYVHPIVFNTQYSLCSVFRSLTAHLMQYAVSTSSEVTSRIVGNYSVPEATDDDIWTNLYQRYGNAESMYVKSLTEDNPGSTGVALVLKSMLIEMITDTYGNVPFTEAGQISLPGAQLKYTTKYEDQREIYRGIVKMLEEANDCFNDPTAENISSIADRMYDGDIDKWQRFGNALYLRTLMRISLKVQEESNGIFVYDTTEGLSINVIDKIAELYSCFASGTGYYPMMRGRVDAASVSFNKYNVYEQTPFYTTTGGNWNAVCACETIVMRMLDTKEAVDKSGTTYHVYVPVSSGGHVPDPRYDAYWRKPLGVPNQMLGPAKSKFFEDHISASGNSLIGRMPNGETNSTITGEIYDVKNADHYNLYNFSEQLFLFAEAGARGWVASISGLGAYLDLFKKGITNSILEWNPHVTADSEEVIEFVNYIVNGEKFSGATFNSGNAVEAILTQKWVSLYFVGIESWCEYRRTGYPLLQTNGPAAENKNILPTRLRYPADEAYRNVEYFQEAVNGWLKGENNMTTDVWWADTQESRSIRLKGRQ